MKVITDIEAGHNMPHWIDVVETHHEPIQIMSKHSNAILVSEADWRSLQETLYLQSIPGMVQSIKEGLQTPLKDCSKEEDLDW